jgi:hypothetical protein
MKRTMIAAVVGGLMAMFSGLVTAQAAPIAAVQAGKSAQVGEPLAQKAGWRHRDRHYRHRNTRRNHWHSNRRSYRSHYARRHYRHDRRHDRRWSNRDYRRYYH